MRQSTQFEGFEGFEAVFEIFEHLQKQKTSKEPPKTRVNTRPFWTLYCTPTASNNELGSPPPTTRKRTNATQDLSVQAKWPLFCVLFLVGCFSVSAAMCQSASTMAFLPCSRWSIKYRLLRVLNIPALVPPSGTCLFCLGCLKHRASNHRQIELNHPNLKKWNMKPNEFTMFIHPKLIQNQKKKKKLFIVDRSFFQNETQSPGPPATVRQLQRHRRREELSRVGIAEVALHLEAKTKSKGSKWLSDTVKDILILFFSFRNGTYEVTWQQITQMEGVKGTLENTMRLLIAFIFLLRDCFISESKVSQACTLETDLAGALGENTCSKCLICSTGYIGAKDSAAYCSLVTVRSRRWTNWMITFRIVEELTSWWVMLQNVVILLSGPSYGSWAPSHESVSGLCIEHGWQIRKYFDQPQTLRICPFRLLSSTPVDLQWPP